MNAGSDNLPVAARNMGGAVVEVLGWEQHQLLPSRVQRSIGYVIARFPELNTEERVDYVADMAGHYGETIDSELTEIFERFNPEMVHAALDLLYELGLRDLRGGERDQLVKTTELLERFKQLDMFDSDHSALVQAAYLVGRLGGLDEAWDMSAEEIAQEFSDDHRWSEDPEDWEE